MSLPSSRTPSRTPSPQPTYDAAAPSRSPYFVSRAEAIKGLSNRFVFSTFYIYLYLAMALLSLATVVLSLMSDCPTATFYILEIVINTTMILEVSIRLVAFGRQFWSSYYNALDLIITVFCVLTLVVIFLSGCSAKGEEVFDVFLLVIRNLFQFGRLALVLRKSGKNVFTRPAPIDLSSARQYAYSLDLDLDDEEGLSRERRALGGDLESRLPAASKSPRLSPSPGAMSRGSSQQQQQQASKPFLIDSDDENDARRS